MTNGMQALRATVQIGAIEIDGFLLPDSSYRMSLTQAAECIDKPARSTFDFLKSKALKRLLQEGGGTFDFLPEDTVQALLDGTYTADQFAVDIGEEGREGQTRIRGVPLELVILYWHWESFRGNKAAFVLVVALAFETLQRRFDAAFGISRTESEYNDRLIAYTRDLESTLARLGEAYAVEDDVRRERDYFLQVLTDAGIDPYALPGNEREEGE